MQDKNCQEKQAPMRRNQKTKESRDRFYARIGIKEIDKIAMQDKKCQEK